MMYELVRPLCRASVSLEAAEEQKRSNLNLKSQQMLLKLMQTEQAAQEVLKNASTSLSGDKDRQQQ
eukprot:CAMPEP_0185575158 /NCGR_PEP_ID=MMETSP0434-20130131/6433_1 /TAXON_ID=626734 ORGANISM="Favella taraikaensis, Strain Fe Narragansett Bay" /NCGR_SAMPLE_ID=MMETSP0434 /ASSEMBLY_ACC=CAM_ASM_000379 /LENGTH=65 /DNA_ID=CAMNT_0028191961 /DNA_START=2257 /DNA_END=2454 /DNA_ORIENTATION=+